MTDYLFIDSNARVVKTEHLRTTFPYKRKFPGIGKISGRVSVDGEAVSGYIVVLVEPESGVFVATTTTIPGGSYEFNNIDETLTYDVIAYDPAGVYEKKISSRRRPVTN